MSDITVSDIFLRLKLKYKNRSVKFGSDILLTLVKQCEKKVMRRYFVMQFPTLSVGA